MVVAERPYDHRDHQAGDARQQTPGEQRAYHLLQHGQAGQPVIVGLLAVVPETDEGRRLAEATVKQLTGGDRLKARRMREDPWQFEPSHTLLMVTNHRPRVDGQDEGMWRRLLLVPFPVRVPQRQRDRQLREKLLREIDVVLTWMVMGFTDWQRRGLAAPDAINVATAEYRGESDLVSRFLNSECLIGPTAKVGSSDLLAAFERWCDKEGAVPTGSKTFSQAVAARLGHSTDRSSHGNVWRGIGLLERNETGDGNRS